MVHAHLSVDRFKHLTLTMIDCIVFVINLLVYGYASSASKPSLYYTVTRNVSSMNFEHAHPYKVVGKSTSMLVDSIACSWPYKIQWIKPILVDSSAICVLTCGCSGLLMESIDSPLMKRWIKVSGKDIMWKVRYHCNYRNFGSIFWNKKKREKVVSLHSCATQKKYQLQSK